MGNSYERVYELFAAALELSPEDREAFLQKECADHPELRAPVQSLLDHDREESARPRFAAAPRSAVELPPLDLKLGQELGPYRLIEMIGRGGTGQVYLAQRISDYGQQIAIKLLREDLRLDGDVQRLRKEMQFLAVLKHPSIAQIFDSGMSDDWGPYFVMEYVDGMSIDAYCDRHQLDIPARLRLFQLVCDAVHFAHKNQIVHRDLKPAHILVDANGTPKLLDFGIARVTNPALLSAPGLIQTDDPPRCTLMYASPEQLRGEHTTTLTDVYSLGAVLCELLTGRNPHDARRTEPRAARFDETPIRPSNLVGQSEHALNHRCLHVDNDIRLDSRPRSQGGRRLRRALRGDLDAIVLKAMSAAPVERYESVQGLSEDIDRYLRGFPVSARHSSPTYRLRKAMQRNPVICIAAILLMSLMAIGTTTILKERDAAVRAAADARHSAEVAHLAERRATSLCLSSQARLAQPDLPQRSVLLAAESVRLADVSGAHYTTALQTLMGSLRTCTGMPLVGHIERVNNAVFSRNGNHLFTAGLDGSIQAWDLSTLYSGAMARVAHAPFAIVSIQLSPCGTWMAASGWGFDACIWRLDDEGLLGEYSLLGGHDGFIWDVAFAPNGKYLFTGSEDGTVRTWNLPERGTMNRLAELTRIDCGVGELQTAGGGHWLVMSGGDTTYLASHSSDVALGAPVAIPGRALPSPIRTRHLVVSPDSRWLLTVQDDHDVLLWDLHLDSPAEHPIRLTGGPSPVQTCCFSGDSAYCAVGHADGTVRAWDLRGLTDSLDPVFLHRHYKSVVSVALSDNGDWVAAGDTGGQIMLCEMHDSAQRNETVILDAHQADVHTLLFDNGCRRLISVGLDKRACVWNLNERPKLKPIVLTGQEGVVWVVKTSADSRWLVTAGADGIPRVWDLLNLNRCRAPFAFREGKSRPTDVSMSANEFKVAIAGAGETVRVWRIRDDGSQLLHKIPVSANSRGRRVLLTPDGHWMATYGLGDAEVLVQYLGAEAVLPVRRKLPGHSAPISCMTVDKGSSWLATGSQDGTVRVWNIRSREAYRSDGVFEGHEGPVNAIALSEDGKWLASGGADGTVRVWSLKRGDALNTIIAGGKERKPLRALSLSQDGRRLITACKDGPVRHWDLASSSPAATGTPVVGISGSSHITVSPDHRWIASWDAECVVRLSRADLDNAKDRTVELAGHKVLVSDVCFSPDSRWLATRDLLSVRLWNLECPNPAEAVLVLPTPQEMSGMRFVPNKNAVLTWDGEGNLYVWPLGADQLLARAAKVVGRNLTEEEWRMFFFDAPYRKTFENLPDGRARRFHVYETLAR